jgi:ubiquinone/menaquinone biosynthesis C-methylase UbiE
MRGRALVGRVARRAPAPLLRRALGTPSYGSAFARFERDGAPPVPVLTAYRNSVKSAWINVWWPTACLRTVAAKVGTAPLREIRELVSGRTLSRPVEELVPRALELQRAFPEYLRLTEVWDARFQCHVVEPVVDEREIALQAGAYMTLAAEIRDVAARNGVELEGRRLLDVGCGTGFLAFALAGLGAGEIVGVDTDLEMYEADPGRDRVIERLAGERTGAVRLQSGDVRSLPFSDDEFDVVFSSTAIEHFADLHVVVAELARVLRPGGLAYHGVEPWFSNHGGHGLCTLDFPWGHARVTADEFERYLALFRPHEVADAMPYFTNAFQDPRLTLDESRAAFGEAFQIIEWREAPIPASDPHRRLIDSAVLDDCRRVYPAVTRRDLLTIGYTVVGRPRKTG